VRPGANLFFVGIALISVELTVMFILPNPEYWSARGLGLGAPVGIALCIWSGVYGRRARQGDGSADRERGE
jgi:hypothetical protein